MRGKVKAQLGFGDEVLGARAAANAVLERMNALAPWSQIQEGLIIKRGTLLDASFVQSAGRHDPQARSMGAGAHKGKHGYKLHVGVDQDSALIRTLAATQANVHEGTVGGVLIAGDEASVIADRAYDRKDLRAKLAAAGAADGLMRKAHAGISDAAKAKIRATNRTIAPIRAAVERIFADFKCTRSLARARYVGLAKNLSHFLLLALTHNLRRWAALTA